MCRCPVIPPQAKSIHWPLPDPAQAKGTHEQKMFVFRQTRDETKKTYCPISLGAIC
ncbi:tyrosine protein phosphatase [Ligilactobacillus aviarius]|nr:tyrosine protein phosphatase [Ligilactobacillus aviarius]PEG72614.1 tyrosine protein phosphatase [Ligilactobacillus aviarius]PEG74397.1 tyrosine protein phosphatase [Ligilactobacillus aviarius]